MLLAIISDTHLPRGGRSLSAPCLQTLRGAYLVVHAGDISTLAVLEELRRIGPSVEAVHGNVDDASLQRSLPTTLELELEGTTIAVVHDAGPAKGRLARLHAASRPPRR